MILTFTITFFFLEENDSKHIFTYEGKYSMPFSNENMENNWKIIPPNLAVEAKRPETWDAEWGKMRKKETYLIINLSNISRWY